MTCNPLLKLAYACALREKPTLPIFSPPMEKVTQTVSAHAFCLITQPTSAVLSPADAGICMSILKASNNSPFTPNSSKRRREKTYTAPRGDSEK